MITTPVDAHACHEGPAEDRALMTADQLATYLQVHLNTIRNYVARDIIPVAAWIGPYPRFHRASVIAALSRPGITSAASEQSPKVPAPTGRGIASRPGRLGPRQEHP